MAETISQHQLRDDDGEILRRVEAGESFVVTRDGQPVAELRPQGRRRPTTLREARDRFRQLPPLDIEQWYQDRAQDDELFGTDVIDLST